MYSFFDEEKEFQLIPIPGNHHLVEDKEGDHTLETLKWFSNYYYAIMEREDGQLQFNDMRYGTFKGEGTDPSEYIFHFVLEDHNGVIELGETEAGPREGEGEKMLSSLWNRIKGNLD